MALTNVFQEVVTAEQDFARKSNPAAIQYLIKQHGMNTAEIIILETASSTYLRDHRQELIPVYALSTGSNRHDEYFVGCEISGRTPYSNAVRVFEQ